MKDTSKSPAEIEAKNDMLDDDVMGDDVPVEVDTDDEDTTSTDPE